MNIRLFGIPWYVLGGLAIVLLIALQPVLQQAPALLDDNQNGDHPAADGNAAGQPAAVPVPPMERIQEAAGAVNEAAERLLGAVNAKDPTAAAQELDAIRRQLELAEEAVAELRSNPDTREDLRRAVGAVVDIELAMEGAIANLEQLFPEFTRAIFAKLAELRGGEWPSAVQEIQLEQLDDLALSYLLSPLLGGDIETFRQRSGFFGEE